MDELNFRRNLYTEPNSKDPEFLAAVNDSQKNKALYQEVKAFDDKLERAMKVDVPDDLANRLLLKQTIDSHQQQRRKSRVHIALAASIAFAVGISYSLFPSQGIDTHHNSVQSLTAHAMEHVVHEQNYFSNQSTHRVSMNNLNSSMAEFGGQFIGSVGELMAAGFCVFDGVRSLHLVFKGEKDTVAVFIMPDANQFDFQSSEIKGNLKAVAKHYQGKQVVIVGSTGEELGQWQSRIDDNVQWSI